MMIYLDVDFLPYEKIADHAHDFLTRQSCENTLPVPIEEIVEFKLKLNIIPLPNVQRETDTEGFISNDLTNIYVDDFVYSNRYCRYRFTLAHEVGHLVLHSHIFRQFTFDSIASWKDFVNQVDPRDYGKLEFQGYAFGGLLLVPPKHLERLFLENLDRVLPLVEQAKAKGYSRKQYLNYAQERISAILAPLFEVSSDVIDKRLEYDSLLEYIP
jgi:Zn-dependent peptidase ImmA (M78 family)